MVAADTEYNAIVRCCCGSSRCARFISNALSGRWLGHYLSGKCTYLSKIKDFLRFRVIVAFECSDKIRKLKKKIGFTVFSTMYNSTVTEAKKMFMWNT